MDSLDVLLTYELRSLMSFTKKT